MMKKLTALGLAICLGFAIGCGGGPTYDASKAATDPPPTDESIEAEVEKGLEEQGMTADQYNQGGGGDQ